MIGRHGFTIANVHTRLTDGGETYQYRMILRSRDRGSAQALAKELLTLPEVIEFRLSPTGD